MKNESDIDNAPVNEYARHRAQAAAKAGKPSRQQRRAKAFREAYAKHSTMPYPRSKRRTLARTFAKLGAK